ncbi:MULTISPECIES: hypothetical protein [Thalassospira]|jgi:hypothetical protein|uniref:Uncharacterized protein n=1 Tax=Thalassospira lohafexi TaxID=744227 RepID=A0A2N3L198_9PROT|nr:hypothetical protein [Thalassospira lohafexi]PKR56581.1 hypothetical protein COO92_20345 [Thalassospira lohafexi]|tara:strand:- start:22781 stop:23173 length:393 start_codon:yes stop_codon:yes gene_type:complete
MKHLDKKFRFNYVRHHIFPEIARLLRLALSVFTSYLTYVGGIIGIITLVVICFAPDEAISIFEELGAISPERLQTGTSKILTLLTGWWVMGIGGFTFIFGRFPFTSKTSKPFAKIGIAKAARPSVEGESQ